MPKRTAPRRAAMRTAAKVYRSGTPAPMTVRLTLGGVDAALVVAEAARERAADWTPVLEGTVDALVTFFLSTQFDTEGAAGGQPWLPLAPRTLAGRKRSGHGRGGILHDTGALRASLTKRTGPHVVRRIDGQSYVRGTTLAAGTSAYNLGGLHQTGTRRNGRPFMPARPIIPNPVPAAWRNAIGGAIANWIARGAD